MCIGCKQCEAACAQQNKLPYDDRVAAESVQSEHKYTVVMTKNDKFMRRLCMHCEHPACRIGLPRRRLPQDKGEVQSYTTSGSVLVAAIAWWPAPLNPAKVRMGRSLNPRVRKCIMCPDRRGCRQADGHAPKSVPTGATKFGDPRRPSQGKRRNASVKIQPTYLPRIYGLNEVGGTSVLILSSTKS